MFHKFAEKISHMLYRHVFDKISTEFRSILRAFENFADLPEFHGTMTALNIRSPDNTSCIMYIIQTGD